MNDDHDIALKELIEDAVTVSGSCDPGWGVYFDVDGSCCVLAWINDDTENGYKVAMEQARRFREVLLAFAAIACEGHS